MSRNNLKILSKSPFFEGIERPVLEKISSNLKPVFISGGEILFHQAQQGDCAYLLVYGRLEAVEQSAYGEKKRIAHIGPGESVGEMALLARAPRSETVRALRDSQLLELHKEMFQQLIEHHPQSIVLLARNLIKRLHRRDSAARHVVGINTIALVSAGGSSQALQPFARRLVRALSREGPTLYLTSEIMKQHKSAAARSCLQKTMSASSMGWLMRQEEKYRFVVYQADSRLSNWTRLCIRQSDRTLLVGRALSRSHLNTVEDFLMSYQLDSTRQQTDLVLIHADPSILPSNTKQWLSTRRVRMHHHVHMQTEEHMQRQVRLLTQGSIGLVLGGGGARGFSHLGVAQALQKNRIPVDVLGGTSSGALVSANLAMGKSAEDILHQAEEIFQKQSPLRKNSIPLVSFFDGKPIERIFDDLFSDVNIEDLWTNFYCVSCDLVTNQKVVHRQGSLKNACLASMAIPGLFPPIMMQGQLLIDGGILDILPTAVMQNINEGPNIVVDVSPQFGLELSPLQKRIPSTKDFVMGWLQRSKKLASFNIISIWVRALSLTWAMQRRKAQRKTDLFLQPPLGNHGLLDFSHLDKLVKIAYKYAKVQLQSWKRRYQSAATAIVDSSKRRAVK
ncbi:MAG: patatin-like phospholipase family protein [Myxococcota bacterium]